MGTIGSAQITDASVATVDITPAAATPVNTQVLTTSTTGVVNWIDLPVGGSDNQTITDFSFNNTTRFLSITLEDGNTQDVDLTDLATAGADNQTATEVPFTPYVTLSATNTQLAIQQLKDELDTATLAGGGENPNNELQDIQERLFR